MDPAPGDRYEFGMESMRYHLDRWLDSGYVPLLDAACAESCIVGWSREEGMVWPRRRATPSSPWETVSGHGVVIGHTGTPPNTVIVRASTVTGSAIDQVADAIRNRLAGKRPVDRRDVLASSVVAGVAVVDGVGVSAQLRSVGGASTAAFAVSGDEVGVVVSNRPLGKIELHTATSDEVEVLVKNTLRGWADWCDETDDDSPFGP